MDFAIDNIVLYFKQGLSWGDRDYSYQSWTGTPNNKPRR